MYMVSLKSGKNAQRQIFMARTFHVLPYNGSLKDRLKLKIIILRDMLKSLNTPMQKTDNVTC